MPTTQPETRTNRLFQIGIPVLLSGLAIWLILRKLDFQVLLSALRQLSVGSILLIIALFTVGLFLRGITCWIILGKEFRFADAFWAMNIGYLLNSIIPLRLGEFGRAAYLTDRAKGKSSYMQVLASIVAERFLDLLVGFSFLLTALLFLFQNDSLKRITWLGFAALALGLGVIILLARHKAVLIQRLSTRYSESTLMTKRILPSLENLLEGLTFFLQAKRLIPAFLLLAISWFFSILEFNVLQNAILPASKWWWPVLVIPASAFVNALPAAPGGLGVFEAGAVGAYALIGVEKEPALAMALVVHFVQIIIPAILGVYALVQSGQSLGGLIQRASSFRKQKEVQ